MVTNQTREGHPTKESVLKTWNLALRHISKKRKFVLIGKGWGENDDKEEKGLDVKRGTGHLDGTSITNDQDLISISSGETVNKDYTVGTCIAGEQDMQVTNLNQESGGGTGPLTGTGNNKEDGLLMKVRGYNDQNKKKTQLSITRFTTKEVKKGILGAK